MGSFRINGSTLSIDDPWGTFEERAKYGRKGTRIVYNAYETMTLNWDVMSASDFHELNSRISSMNGQRQSCTIPGRSSDWRTVYCNLDLPVGSERLNYVTGVSVAVSYISTSSE